MVQIDDLDQFLLTVVAGQPPLPRQYEFRCHPDVLAAIHRASEKRTARCDLPLGNSSPGLYGAAAIEVDPQLGSGRWELRELGRLVNRGEIYPPCRCGRATAHLSGPGCD